MTRLALVALGLALSGCATSLGTIGVAVPDAGAMGLKMLRPAATGRACRSTLLGLPLADGEPRLQDALAEILALDAEGNVVVNAEVRWRRLVTGVYNRRCVEVRGDLARSLSTITLPAPPGHHHEGH
jgi:hypothetical protein